MEEELSLATIEKTARRCPISRIPIPRSAGSDDMKCPVGMCSLSADFSRFNGSDPRVNKIFLLWWLLFLV